MKPADPPIATAIACLARQPAFSRPAVECAVHLSPCHVDTGPSLAGIDDSDEARDFLSAKAAARLDGRAGLVGLVRYSLSVFAEGIATLYEIAEDFNGSSRPSSPRACRRPSGARNTRPLSSTTKARCSGTARFLFDGWSGTAP